MWRTFSAEAYGLAGEEAGPPDTAPVLMVHGWCCNRAHMHALGEELARDRRVINVDLPAHGETPSLEGAPELPRYAAALAKFIARRGLEKVTLVGHSMGGMLNIMTAGAMQGESAARLARVVNIDGAVPFTARGHEGYRTLFESVQRTGFRATIEPFIRKAFFLPEERGPRSEPIILDMLMMPESTAAALFAQFPKLDAPVLLAGCKVPLFYIGAAQPRFDIEAVKALRPSTKFAQVQSGHFAQVFATDEVARFIRDFSIQNDI